MKKWYLSVLLCSVSLHLYGNTENIFQGSLVRQSCSIYLQESFAYIDSLNQESIVVNLKECPLTVRDTLSIALDLNNNEFIKFDLKDHNVNYSFIKESDRYLLKSQYFFPEIFIQTLKKQKLSETKYNQILINALYH